MKFDYLSDNAFLILNEIFENTDLMKLIHYPQSNPLEQADIENKSDVFMNTLSPIPFTFVVPTHEGCELRVFLSNGKVKHRAWLNSIVFFQFVYHNNTCLINMNGVNKIRFYEVLNKIVETFENRSIGTLGILNFEDMLYRFYPVGTNAYGMYEISAKLGTVGG
jgi:hypothetical protein